MSSDREQDKKRAKPTAADKAAAAKAWAIFQRLKREKGLTQEKVAELYGGKTQGAISQYLKGKVPWNAAAVIRFAHIFGCSPLDIRDDLPELKSIALPPTDPRAQELWLLWPDLDDLTKNFLLDTARRKLESESGPFTKADTAALRRKRRTG